MREPAERGESVPADAVQLVRDPANRPECEEESHATLDPEPLFRFDHRHGAGHARAVHLVAVQPCSRVLALLA